MSLLGSQVFANPTNPCWVGSSGNQVISNLGSLAVGSSNSSAGQNGFITGGRIAASRAINPTFGNFALSDAGGTTVGGLNQVGTPGASDVIVTTTQGRKIFFGAVGAGSFNSSMTVSAPGANLDLLSVGGTVDALALKLANTGGAAVVGSGTLVGGLAQINTTASDVTSYILVSRTAVNASTALGNLRVSSKNANNFIVTSADSTTPTNTVTGDESSFDWVIINPA